MVLARVLGPGHPDRACDLVAAAVTQEYVRRDPTARLAVHVQGGHGALFVTGDVCSTADFDVASVAKAALGTSGVAAETEPFVMMESVAPSLFPVAGARDPMVAFGYATAETEERLPLPVAQARRIAQALERKRIGDAEWYWMGPDYDVTMERRGGQTVCHIRVQHVEGIGVNAVREAVFEGVRQVAQGMDLRVNAAGVEALSGLQSRVGRSSSALSVDGYGAMLPIQAFFPGSHIAHPSVAGIWLARAAATSLVRHGLAKAAMVHLSWLPLETRPVGVRAKNERGEDLGDRFAIDRFDLARLPEGIKNPDALQGMLRAPFDDQVTLPWEGLDLLG